MAKKKKGGFFSRFSLFEDVQEKTPQPENDSTVTNDGVVETNFGRNQRKRPANQGNQVNAVGVYDEKIAQMLDEAIEAANLEGEDYFEFVQGLRNMSGIAMADTMKVQAVLATLHSKGLTAARVVETSEHYKQVLTEKKEAFETQVAQQMQEKVGSKEQRLSEIEKLVQEKSKQIQALTQEINEMNQEKVGIQAEIQQDKLKIQATHKNFQVTFGVKMEEIDNNVTKVISSSGVNTQQVNNK